MKHAMWVDLVNMLLWAITASYGTYRFFKARQEKRASAPRVGIMPAYAGGTEVPME